MKEYLLKKEKKEKERKRENEEAVRTEKSVEAKLW